MPISDEELRSVKTVGGRGYDRLVLDLEDFDLGKFQCAVLSRREGGVLLLLPGALEAEELLTQEGVVAYFRFAGPVQGGRQSESKDVELLGLDLESGFCQLVYRWEDRKEEEMTPFDKDNRWPDSRITAGNAKEAYRASLQQAETGEGMELFFTADEKGGDKEKEKEKKTTKERNKGPGLDEMRGLMSEFLNPIIARIADLERNTKKPPLPTRAKAPLDLAMEMGPPPGTRGRKEAPGQDEGSGDGEGDSSGLDLSADEVLKLALAEMIKDRKGLKKKKRIPGLDGNSEDSEEEKGGALRGAKGINEAEKLRRAFRENEKEFVKKFQKLLMLALDEAEVNVRVARKFVKSLPMGKSKQLGYVSTLFGEILGALEDGQTNRAKLLCYQSLAAVETFLLQDSWEDAWQVTHLPQPAWGAWQQVDVQEAKREHICSRLTDASWNAAYIAEIKDHDFLQKRRKDRGKGKGKEKEKDEG
eukprot:TRINITY_DN93157_c0_g1_i1.p1 TRINITY_DN93157_c0_g1~~TRINITY_DN93157_c0_g1_i1.p1  ORF type:complete len:474 (-),score=125.37 TRINITY_DN93157_c0_g1_i1:197-1618(-)